MDSSESNSKTKSTGVPDGPSLLFSYTHSVFDALVQHFEKTPRVSLTVSFGSLEALGGLASVGISTRNYGFYSKETALQAANWTSSTAATLATGAILTAAGITPVGAAIGAVTIGYFVGKYATSKVEELIDKINAMPPQNYTFTDIGKNFDDRVELNRNPNQDRWDKIELQGSMAVDMNRAAALARANAWQDNSPDARDERSRNAALERAGAWRDNSPDARDERTRDSGMTGGRFPGKDQDDRDMAAPGIGGGRNTGLGSPSTPGGRHPKDGVGGTESARFDRPGVTSHVTYGPSATNPNTKTSSFPGKTKDDLGIGAGPSFPGKVKDDLGIGATPSFPGKVKDDLGVGLPSPVTTKPSVVPAPKQPVARPPTIPAPVQPRPQVDLPTHAPIPTPAPRGFFGLLGQAIGPIGALFGGFVDAIGGLVVGAVTGFGNFLGGIFSGGNGGGTRGSGNTGSGASGKGGSVGPVGDHNGNNRGNDNSRGNGWNGHPVLLDLTGNGLSVDGLGSSSRFVDLAGDGYQHRTAWAGDGNGVLVFDADGDGKISRSSEFIFTEWDKSETSDLRALKKVFDTNGNGKLDAGDARWADFKVMVGDQLVSLASLGITSIDLTPKGSGQSFEDGSAITGTTTYTKSDGTIGQVGDAVLSGDENGYTVKRTKVTNSDGSTTEDLLAYNKDGSLAFRNLIITSADGSHKLTKFDDDGNGTFDRSQTVDLTVDADGTRKRVVANFNVDGSLLNKTTTATSPDKKTVTISIDQDGDGQADQSQIFVSNSDGSTSTTVKSFAVDGSLIKQTTTTSSADGLTKVIKLDESGNGTFNLETTEATIVATDGARTKTVTQKSADGTLLGRVITVTSADGRSETIDYDRAGAGSIDEREASVTATAADGSVTNTVTSYNRDGTLRGKTIATTSADGLAHTLSEDLDGDGIADRTNANITLVAGDGSRSQTAEQRAGNGTLLSKQVTTTSADRKTISAVTDANGDGAADQTTSIVVDANGVTTSVVSKLNANGSLIGKVQSVSSADGLTQTTDEDIDGDATYDRTTTDVTIVNADGSRTQTVQHYARGGAANGILLDKTITTISQDSLTKTIASDIDGDGVIDRTVVDAIVLNGDNSRTETVTSNSSNGTKLAQTVTTVSADRKTTTVAEDLNGDNAVDRSTVTTVNANGSKVTTVTERASDGTLIRKSEANVSANGLTTTTRSDVNGDGSNDVTTTRYTVINGDGSRTTTSKEWAGTTLVSQSVTGVSGNGLNKTTLVDLDGDLTFDRKEDDFTSYSADGSTTRTITQTAGTSTVASRRKITTSATGLGTKVEVDVDGDGSYDQSTIDVKQLAADGSTTEVIDEWSGDGTRLSKTTITISADKKSATTTVDSDGNGTIDLSKSISVGNDGITTTTEKAFSPNGTLISSKQTSVSANGLSTTVKEDWNGDGTYEKATSSTVVLNADGSRTATVAATSANGTLLSGKTITTTSESGLSKVQQVDLTGDGVVDETTSSIKTLGLDGSETLTVETRAGNATLLAKSVETTTADRKTRTASYDDNGDGAIDRTVSVVVNANGSTTTTATGIAANGTTIANKVTDVSTDGLTTTVREDFDGNGTFDKVTVDQITIGADGAKTRRITEQLGTGPSTVVSQSTTAANAYEVTTDDYDRGWLENRNIKKTVFNSDGTVTTTETNVAGSQAIVVNKTTTTVSANGLVTTVAADLDGNGSVDRTSTKSKTLSADGKTTETVSLRNGSSSLIARTTTTTSADGNKVTTQYDLDGDGYDDLVKVAQRQANGSTIETIASYSGTGATWGQNSLSTKTTSADGLTETIETDTNGDEAIDRSSRSSTVFNADGSKTQTFTNSGPAGALKDKTTVTTSANGLVVSTDWMANGTSITRSLEDITTLNADGSTVRSFTYKKAGGALESKSTTTTSADKKTVTKTFDLDGNGVIDQKSTRIVNADGSVTTTYLDLGADGVQAKARKIVTESGNGLTVTTDYDTNGDGTVENRVVETAVLNADGSKTTTITRYSGTSQAVERTIVVLSADGKTQTTSYDLNADGTIDKKQTTSTAFGAHSGYADAKTDTIENVVGSTVTSRFQTSTSANGQSTTKEWDIDGNGTIDQTATETTSITNQGTVRTVSAYAGATKISSSTTTTNNDGRTKTIIEERPLSGFSNRTITTNTTTMSDGATVEKQTLTNTTNGVVEKQVTTTSADERQVTIERDIDGNGTVDHLEKRTKFVDGSTRTTIDALYSKATFTTSADGLTSTAEWDMDLDGNVDRRRLATNTTNADGSRSSVATDYKVKAGTADSRVRIVSASTSSDGRTKSVSVDTNGDGVFDQVSLTTIDVSGATVSTTTNNAEAQKAENLISGEIYWKQAIAAKVVTTISSDGLTVTEQSDYDGNGSLETTAVSRTRVDGSVVTEFTELNASGGIVAKGTLTVSNDGRTKIFSKDADNNGTVDHTEKTELYIDGTIVRSTSDYNPDGSLKQSTAENVTSFGFISTRYVWDAAHRKTEMYARWSDGTATQYTYVGADEAVRSAHTLNKEGKLVSGIFYDPKSTDPWTRIEQSYNSDGKKILEKQFMDDGTRIDIDFDAASGKQTLAKTYDTAVRLIAQATYANGILASNILYDPANTKSWSRIEQTYTSDGTKVSVEKQFMDNGTRTDITFDAANNQYWSSIYDYYDASGRWMQRALFYDTTNVRRDEYFDYTGTQYWINIVEFRNSAGALTDRYQYNDDGTRTYTFYDSAGSQIWKNYTNWYDTADRLVQHEVNNDDGSRYLDYRDAANTASWSLIAQYFNALGQRTEYNETSDNGTRVVIYYDPTNTQNWSSYYYYYDAAGRCTNTDIRYDDGTRYYDYRDITNSSSWYIITELYNAAGQITYQGRTNDDSSYSQSFWDAAGAYNYWTYVGYYNAAGQNTAESFVYDNGTGMTVWYNNLSDRNIGTYYEYYNTSGQMYRSYSRPSYSSGTDTSYDVANAYNWKSYATTTTGNGRNQTTSYYVVYDDGRVYSGSQPPDTGGGGGGHRPVALDLDGNGAIDVKQLAPDARGPRFDWDGDGVREQTSWIASGDGILVIDLASDGSSGADGLINQAKELAFNLWLNGESGESVNNISDLEALRLAFDTNRDNVFNNSDERWGEFRVWQDANQDGVVNAGELRTLAEAGIRQIGLTSSPEGSVKYEDGSEVVGTNWYEAANGTRSLVGDVKLVSSNAQPVDSTMSLSAKGTGNSLAPANARVDSLVAAMASFGANSSAGATELNPDANDGIGTWKQDQLAASSRVWSAA